MSTQQDIYAAGSESRPPMLKKENYVTWSSRLLRYAKSRPNRELIHNSILNVPYVRRMIPEPGDANREIEADDQAIQTIFLGLSEDIYAAVDSCETAQEIWLRVQQMMKGSNIIIHEKKAKLFNEWERFTSNEGESIESYYHPPHQDQSSFNQNYMQQPMPNPEDITDPTTAMNMALALMANAFKLNYSSPTNNNQRISSNPCNRQIAQPGNLNGYNAVQNVRNQNRNGNLVAVRAEGNATRHNGNQIRCYNYRGAEEYDLMAAAADLDEIKEVNANCILMANLPQASTSEEQYTELLEPILEPQQVPQNNNNVIFKVTSVEQCGEIVEQHSANFEETRTLYDSLYQSLAIEVEKVNSVNRKLKETNADLTIELARYKNQERCFEISQKKYDKLERCYQQFVYQEQYLSKKINALHLSTDKQIMTLNEQISDLNKQLSKEKSTVSFLLEENKKLKSDFKTYEDKILDKQIQLEKKIKELNNILLKTGQSIQMVHMLSPKPNSFYHTEQKMALGYQNPFYLKQAQKKQQSLYDGKVLLEKHDPPVVHDSKETLQLAQESHEKMKQMNKEIKPANYTKINHLLGDYKDMQQKIERLQAQLGNLKGQCKDTSCVSDTRTLLSRKLKNENVELEFQVLNYARENAHLKATYKNLFDFIFVSRTQTKTIIASLQNNLQSTIYKNAKLRTQLFKKVSEQKDNTCDTSANTKFAKQSTKETLPKLDEIHALSKPVTSNLVLTPQESKGVKNNKVIAPGIFRINPFKTSREEKHVPNTVRASDRTKPITVSQSSVITKKDVNSDKFMGTVRFENDHVAAILGFGDLQWGNILITRVYFVKGLGHNVFSVGQFCDSDLAVAFRRNACFVSNLEGVDLLKEDRSTNLYNINLHEMASTSPILEQRNRMLVEAARTMLIFSRAPLFLWAEAITTACFTQNRSIIHRRFNKTPYELINGRKLDISFLHVFEALCYPKNDREDIRKLGAKGLDLTYAPSTITTQQPTEGELGLLFEAMYDDYIGGQPSASVETVLTAQEHQVHQTSTKSTAIADTAPTLTNSSSLATNIPITSQDIDELNPNAMVDGNAFVNPFANSSTSDAESSSSQNNVKEVMTDPAWIGSMQEELLQFKRMDVWVLVAALDNISPLTLKWIFKNKHDEEKTVIRNKSRLVVRGYRQEEGLDFEESFVLDSGFELTRFSDVDYAAGELVLKEARLYGVVNRESRISIAISCNLVQHSRTKHIVVHYHFIKEHVEKGMIELYFVKTDYQLANIFTKALSADCFNYLVRRLGMRSLSPKELERLAKSQ
nr:hypothetical protein [Tanacetum cinerariifolium]